jgi:hypothetical protein
LVAIRSTSAPAPCDRVAPLGPKHRVLPAWRTPAPGVGVKGGHQWWRDGLLALEAELLPQEDGRAAAVEVAEAEVERALAAGTRTRGGTGSAAGRGPGPGSSFGPRRAPRPVRCRPGPGGGSPGGGACPAGSVRSMGGWRW